MPVTSAASAIKAGTVAHFAANSAPAGWLKANGAAISRSAYAGLFAAIGTTYGAGDGSTTFNLPDLRGEFLRGWEDGRGVDAGRSFGAAQQDAMQGHHHNYWVNSSVAAGFTDIGGRYADGAANLDQDSTNGHVRNPTSDGVNGSPRTATETRPRNVALLACIKF